MTFSDLPLPILTVNGYLWDTMKLIEPSFEKKYKKVPFFPISDSASGTESWDSKPYIVYDRMMRMQKGPFYPIKKDHFLYYLKGNEQNILEWGMAIQYILDRQDDAAQDINDWNRQQTSPSKIYFHHLRVYQTDSGEMGSPNSTRDFSTRPFYISRFIVDVEYHFTDSIESILTNL